ncbi:MAG: heme biosynthesis HemY N-terminal domain-containing protein [Pseudomonadota bacterium]
MIRMLIFIVATALAAGAAIKIAALDGEASLRFENTLIEAPFGLLVVAGLLFAVAVAGATRLWVYFVTLPKRMKARRDAEQRRKGLVALTRGFAAVAAGDAANAQAQARAADRNLNAPSLTRLLSAQAAQAADDQDAVKRHYTDMLADPEAEFLALRGLYAHADRTGDKRAALAHAQRAFELRPGAEWAYRSVFALQLERGAWGDARAALAVAARNGHESQDAARRRKAVLLTADAAAAEAGGDEDAAREDATLAAKTAPDFAPAALIAARRLAAAGRMGGAAKAIEAAWAAAPHPSLADAYAALKPGEMAPARAKRMMKLADKNTAAPESGLLRAEQHVALEDWDGARKALVPVLKTAPTARALGLMAEIERAQTGDETRARPWLNKALEAPRDARFPADAAFNLTVPAWGELVRRFGDAARLDLPALAAAPAVSEAEIAAALESPAPAPEAAADAENGRSEDKDVPEDTPQTDDEPHASASRETASPEDETKTADDPPDLTPPFVPDAAPPAATSKS